MQKKKKKGLERFLDKDFAHETNFLLRIFDITRDVVYRRRKKLRSRGRTSDETDELSQRQVWIKPSI